MKMFIILDRLGRAYDYQHNEMVQVTEELPLFVPVLVMPDAHQLLMTITEQPEILAGGRALYEVTDNFDLGEKIAEGSHFRA